MPNRPKEIFYREGLLLQYDDRLTSRALEEMRDMMFAGKMIIAGHNSELIEELRHYHRIEDYKIVKQRDDLVCALRYAIMMRRSGRPLLDCEGIGYGPMPWAGQHRSSNEQQIARGVEFDVFTGR